MRHTYGCDAKKPQFEKSGDLGSESADERSMEGDQGECAKHERVEWGRIAGKDCHDCKSIGADRAKDR